MVGMPRVSESEMLAGKGCMVCPWVWAMGWLMLTVWERCKMIGREAGEEGRGTEKKERLVEAQEARVFTTTSLSSLQVVLVSSQILTYSNTKIPKYFKFFIKYNTTFTTFTPPDALTYLP